VIKNNKHVYPYGNYHQYYGYRTPNVEEDPRLKVLHASWLEGKDCLDVGCNVGTLTFEIARVFKAC
jgi:7SK snRNA methylphosphate capping enzyme